MDHFCYFCFVFVMLSRPFTAALRSPARKEGWSLGSLVCDFLYACILLCFCHFVMRCPGSGVVLDCIDSCGRAKTSEN